MATLTPIVLGQRKPVIQPGFADDTIEAGLRQHLHPTQSHWDQWGAGWIPEFCKNWANSHGLNPSDFEVFNVHYTDCEAAWVFCRHRSAPPSQVDMIDLFGRMPVHMREYVIHVLAVPHLNDGIAATWENGNVAFRHLGYTMKVMTHELSHGLDFFALNQYGSPFSGTSIWTDNWAADSRIVSDYAGTNFVENFAETGVIGVYDKVVPGGIGSIQPNWQQIFHQYATFQGFLGDTILPGGTCRGRRANSAPVPMSSSARLGPKPDVSLPSNVTEIENLETADVVLVNPL